VKPEGSAFSAQSVAAGGSAVGGAKNAGLDYLVSDRLGRAAQVC